MGEHVPSCRLLLRARHAFHPPRGATGAAVLCAAGRLFIRFTLRGGYLGRGRSVGGGVVGECGTSRYGEDPGGCGPQTTYTVQQQPPAGSCHY